jgi:hypothetical protein
MRHQQFQLRRWSPRYGLVSIGLLVAALTSPVNAFERMGAADLHERGQALLASLQETYKRLQDDRRLSGSSTDITESVLRFIPAGISFADAEAILRDAGFSIEYPEQYLKIDPRNRPRDWYAVLGVKDPFVQLWVGKVSVYVTLLPKSPGDYSAVEKVSASLWVSLP